MNREAKEEFAKMLCASIKLFSEDEEALENFECYLSHHFDVWMKKFAYDPQGLAMEFWRFATIYKED